MKQLLEFIPIALFFIVYQMDGKTIAWQDWAYTFDGIFTATGVMMAATIVQVTLTWVLTRKLDKRLFWTSAAVIVFGSATLLLHNNLFIQWKPSVFNWAMALVFAGSTFVGKRNMLERLMGSQINLPARVWMRTNWLWAAHFSVVGCLNLIVAYNYSEATWVSYKLYSSIGFTLVLMVLTAMFIGPYLKEQTVSKDTEQ